jgi:hypothetical protein
MTDSGWIEPIVQRVVGEVLDTHVAQLRSEIVRRVVEQVAAQAATNATANSTVSDSNRPTELARAVAEIQLGSSQREILRALLDTSSRYASRVALFVVKGNRATGWQGRGFTNNEAVKDFSLDSNSPAVQRAIVRDLGEQAGASIDLSAFDANFLQHFGSPASAEARILPLILKDKVAALLYADSGSEAGGLLEAGALDLFVLSTSAWLEVNALRKHAQKEPAAQADHQHFDAPAEAAPAPAAPAFNDPFASHTPAFSAHAMAATASAASAPVVSAAVHSPEINAQAHTANEAQSAVAEMEPPPIDSEPVHSETSLQSAAPTLSPTLSPEDQDVHRKAQRFARLLVDEIKLYNQANVAEGRKNHDLYDRLQDVIDKSRVTYQKRYGNTVAASADYFHREIIRSLAEDNVSVMGANFRQ